MENNHTPPYHTDSVRSKGGNEILLRFFRHASFAIGYNDRWIYIDPVSDYADYSSLPKADLIVVTHSHYDHLDREAIGDLRTPQTTMICDQTSATEYQFDWVHAMRPNTTLSPRDYVKIDAMEAYNTTPDHLDFHPRERGDCGYVLTIDSTQIYISGDGENTPASLAERNIDIAFISVNQPYTRTVDQAIDSVKSIKPSIFYPYHYGEVEQRTDIERLAEGVKGITEIRIRDMQ